MPIKGEEGVVPIKGEEETSSYKVVCAYQRGGGGLCLSKGGGH